jgi:hypothetical protein
MAKLSNEVSETIWSLKRQLADVIENAKAAEFVLFDTFGENERTVTYLTDLQSVAEQATDRFSQLTTLQIRVFNVQPGSPALYPLRMSVGMKGERIDDCSRAAQRAAFEA